MTTLPDALAGFVGQAAFWLLTYLIHSTVLIGGAWLVTRFARLEPGARDFVWRVALLGGVVTASGTTYTVSARPEVDVVRRVAVRHEVRASEGRVEAEVPEAGTGEAELTERVLSELAPLEWVGARAGPGDEVWRAGGVNPGPECQELLRRGPTPDPGWIRRVDELCATSGGVGWRLPLLLFWLVGAACGLIGLGRGHGAIRALATTLTPAGLRSREALAALLPATGSARVMSSPHLSSPCALPGRTIGIPTRCEAELSQDELRAVVAHELAHVVRRDVGWSGVLRSIVAVFWLQPLNRLALQRALAAAEEACDDWALSRTGARVSLATSISRVAEWATASLRDPLPVSMAGRDGGAVAQRVRRILSGRGRPERRWQRVLAAMVIALPLPLLPTLPAPSQLHAAVWIEQRDVTAMLPAVGPTESERVSARIIVARFEGG